MKQIVMPNRHIEEVAGSNPGRVVIIVFCPGCRDGYPRGTILRRRTSGQGSSERWEDVAAEQPCLNLLVCGKPCPRLPT
jgi:hypothetical protein